MSTETILIHGAGSELQGVGRLPDGRAVFVPGALPGEQAQVEITREAPRFCEARLLKVIKAAPERVEPACPHYGRCGGCSARHMNYEASLRLKWQRVFDALSRLGGVANPKVLETIGSSQTERSRNKAEYAAEYRGGNLTVGCMEKGSHRVLSISDCLLQKEASIRALNWAQAELPRTPVASHLKSLVTRVNREGRMTVVFSVDAPVQGELAKLSPALRKALPEVDSIFMCRLKPRPSHALDGVCSLISGEATLVDTLLGLKFELSPQSFLQVNPPQAEALYKRALEGAGAAPGMRLLDAYCGAGTISLAAAQLGAEVLGVEIVPPAIENAKRNAKLNGLEKQARFVCADAAKEIPRRIAAGERFDAAIVDPPRKGVEASVLHALADAKIPRISYVSCNPSTLARDVKILCERGYRLEWAQPVDMFPWTEHVETVALLAKENA